MTLPRPTRKINDTSQPTPSIKSDEIDLNSLRPSDLFVFDPKPDITAQELAFFLMKFYAPAVHFKHFLDFPKLLQRHFRRTNEQKN